jgi:endosialidase-like protein
MKSNWSRTVIFEVSIVFAFGAWMAPGIARADCANHSYCEEIVQSNDGLALFTYSQNGTGIYSYSGQVDGVEGQGNVSGRSGVYGHNTVANGGYGVYGAANGSGQAVHGENTSSSGWAGYFNGRVFLSQGYQSSDARLKQDIKDLRYGLEQLAKLRPVAFKWKKGSGSDGEQLGLIAQEVQKVVPEVVDKDATTGMLSINYVALLPIAIKAIQQQEARIAELERARKPVMSSLVSESLGGGLVLGLPVLALFAALRKRRATS